MSEAATRPDPQVFPVEAAHLDDFRVGLPLGIACQNLACSIAITHGIEDPDDEWLGHASDILRARIEEVLAHEVVESPSAWKARLAEGER